RSARLVQRCRPSCYGSWRSAKSRASAAWNRCLLTSALLLRQIGRSRHWLKKENFVRTFFTASTSSRLSCLRYVTAFPTCLCSLHISWINTAESWVKRLLLHPVSSNRH